MQFAGRAHEQHAPLTARVCPGGVNQLQRAAPDARQALCHHRACNTNHPVESRNHGTNTPIKAIVSRAKGTFDENAHSNPPPPCTRDEAFILHPFFKGRLIFGVFAAFAEFERELIRERTKAGIRAARRRGKSSI